MCCLLHCMVLIGKFVVIHGAPREQPTFNLNEKFDALHKTQVNFFMRPHSTARSVSSQFIQVDGKYSRNRLHGTHCAALLHDSLWISIILSSADPIINVLV